jgi:hypothetical protein
MMDWSEAKIVQLVRTRRVHKHMKKNLVTANVSRLMAHVQVWVSEGRRPACVYEQCQLFEVEQSRTVGLTPTLSVICTISRANLRF